MATRRTTAAGRFQLELDGAACGDLIAAEGGEAVASVVVEAADGEVRKRLGALSFEPLRLTFGAGMAAALYEWIGQWLQGKAQPRNGAVVRLDERFGERERVLFESASIAEVTFPAGDASSKDVAYIALTLQPLSTRREKAAPGTPAGAAAKTAKHKQWLASNFRLTLGDLPTKRVTKVDSVTVRQARELDDETRPRSPQRPDVSDLAVTLAESDAKAFDDWFDEFAIHGRSDDQRDGSLEFLAADLKSVLFTLTLSRTGLTRVRRLGADSGRAAVARVRAEVYCEQVAFDVPDAGNPARPARPARPEARRRAPAARRASKR
jgi:hypothetical protein